jgi:hypothetical protein
MGKVLTERWGFFLFIPEVVRTLRTVSGATFSLEFYVLRSGMVVLHSRLNFRPDGYLLNECHLLTHRKKKIKKTCITKLLLYICIVKSIKT